MRIAIPAILCLFLCGLASAQPSGQLSVVQVHPCTITAGNNSCGITVSPNLAAGNGYIFACATDNNAGYPTATITSVSAGGTLKEAYSASAGMFYPGSNRQESVRYILPSTSTGGTSPVTITLGANVTATSYCYLAEFHPSANPNNVNIDIDGAFQTASTTSAVNQNATLSGVGSVVFQMYVSGSGNSYASAVSSPYNTNAFFSLSGVGVGFSIAQTNSGNGATWTLGTANTVIASSVGFSYNPINPSERSFNDLTGGTNGSPLTVAPLTASQHGWQGGTWNTSGVINLSYYTNAAFKLPAPTTRYAADGTTYPKTPPNTGIGIVGAGALQQDNVYYSWGFPDLPIVKAGGYFWSDYPPTDQSSLDCTDIYGQQAHDFESVNCYGNSGTRYFNEEAGFCSAAFNCSPTQPDIPYPVAASVSGTVSGGTVTFTGTFTAAQWPAGVIFMPSGCTGGSNYNFNQFTVVTSSSTQITAAAGTTAGTTTGCVVAPWVFIEQTYSTVGSTTTTGSVAGGIVTFTGTFTPSQWPVNLPIAATGCAGGTNYNTNLFYVISATTTTVTANAAGLNGTASGGATGCSLAGQHVLQIFNTNGTLMGTQFVKSIGNDVPGRFQMGNLHSQSGLTAGTHAYWSNFQLSFSGERLAPNAAPPPSCSGASPFWLSTPDFASLSSCVTSASSGDTINVTQGPATYSSQLSISGKALNLSGATICTGSGDPFATGSIACADNTNITINTDQAWKENVSAANFIYTRGFTFTCLTVSHFCEAIDGTHGQVGYRWHHNHNINPVSGGLQALGIVDGWGLSDHNWNQDTNTSGPNTLPYRFEGNSASLGYQDWEDSFAAGTFQANYVEDDYFTMAFCDNGSTEGLWDSYEGAKIVTRFNTIVGCNYWGGHGLDSGGLRSSMWHEVYFNAITNSLFATPAYSSRGGSTLFFKNTFSGTATPTTGGLDYFRVTGQASSASWGRALQGLNWTPVSAIPTTGVSCGGISCAGVVTLGAPNWQASHSYTCSTAAPCFIAPTVNNAGNFGSGYNFITTTSCVSGGSAPSWNQTFFNVTWGTTNDGTCVWSNAGGSGAARPGVGNGFLSTAADSPCSSGVNCTYYLDSLGGTGGTAPYRDQIGRVANQVLFPAYEWLNTGITTTWGSGAPNVVANQDFYNYNASFTGATGVGSGTYASKPGSCTNGTAYWATDQGTWNQSGNGAGQGQLYICAGGVFPAAGSASYIPAIYPDPLQGIGVMALSPAANNFGSIPLGGSSAAVTFTLTNNSGSSATTLSATITGTNSADFSISANSCTGSLSNGGATCTLNVTFTPSGNGSRTATLSISYSSGDGASPQTSSLSGIGLASLFAPGNPFLMQGRR